MQNDRGHTRYTKSIERNRTDPANVTHMQCVFMSGGTPLSWVLEGVATVG